VFFLGRRFRKTIYCFWLLVTLFPLSDGGVLVAVTTCAVLRGGGCYSVPAVSVAYLLPWSHFFPPLLFFLFSACLNNACEALFDCLDVQISGRAVMCLSTYYGLVVSVVLQFLPGIRMQPFLGLWLSNVLLCCIDLDLVRDEMRPVCCRSARVWCGSVIYIHVHTGNSHR
jgi:hypothetical protein